MLVWWTLLPGVPIFTMFPGEAGVPKQECFPNSLAISGPRPLPGVSQCSLQPWALSCAPFPCRWGLPGSISFSGADDGASSPKFHFFPSEFCCLDSLVLLDFKLDYSSPSNLTVFSWRWCFGVSDWKLRRTGVWEEGLMKLFEPRHLCHSLSFSAGGLSKCAKVGTGMSCPLQEQGQGNMQ